MAQSMDVQSEKHKEECMSRQLVVIRSLALIVNPMREYVIKILENNKKKYAPHLQSLTPAKNLRKAFKEDFENITDAKIKDLITIHGSKFPIDILTIAKLFLPDYDMKKAKSFSEIYDPKVYLDILKNVPHISLTKEIVGNAKILAVFRNTTGKNKFLQCTEEDTSKFFDTLKKLTKEIVPGAKADEIICEIEKWEGRKLSFMPQNLKKLEDNQMIKEVIDAWQPIRDNGEEMSEMNEKIVQLQEYVYQKLEEHDSKFDEQDLKFGDLGSKLDEHDSFIHQNRTHLEQLKLNTFPTTDDSKEQLVNIDATIKKFEKAPDVYEKADPIKHKHKKICADNLGYNWREFGRHEEVNFKEGQMDNIEKDNNYRQYETIYRLIHDWCCKLGSKATVSKLAKILEDIDMKHIADEVRQA